MNDPENAIQVRGLETRFGDLVVHKDVNFDVRRGEIFAVAGPSGCGKSVLLREILLLQKPDKGSIRLFGREIVGADEAEIHELRQHIGVLFQNGALFNALTLLENITIPMLEHTDIREGLADEIAAVKLELVDLPLNAANRPPAQLSGGMQKRAALARALALDPEVLFLDEPTTGLDPKSAEGLDTLVAELRQSLGLTIMIVTHDLDTLWTVADRVGILSDGRMLEIGSMKQLSKSKHPEVRTYFEGSRGRAARH